MKDMEMGIKKKMLESLIEHLSMMPDPLEKEEGDEEKSAGIEVVKIEAKPEMEEENEKEESEENDETEEELLKKTLKKKMAMGY